MSIGPIQVTALVIGITETAKNALGLEGRQSVIFALIVGAILQGLAYAMAEGLVPAEAVPYIETVVYAIAGSIAAMGYYDLATKKLFKRG